MAPHYAEDMPVRARDAAAELRRELSGLPAKKLHKLLYYCQGHHLAATGEPLFTDSISAWDMGPVVGTLWHEEGELGTAPAQVALNQAQLNTIGYVVSRYGRLTGRDLELLCHAEPPWQRADLTRPPHGSVQIKNSWMLEYFVSESDEDDDRGFASETVSDWLAMTTAEPALEKKPDSYDELVARLADAT